MSAISPPPSLTAYDLHRGTVELRPLSVIDMIDGAFSVCRANKRLIAATVLLIMVPLQLLAAFFQRDAIQQLGAALQAPGVATGLFTGEGEVASLLTSLATQVLVTQVLFGALTLIAGRGAAGAPLSGQQLVRATARRSGVLIGAYIGLGLIRFGPLLLAGLAAATGSFALVALLVVVGFVWAVVLTPFIATVTPALMLEDRPATEAISHAVRLARRGYWRVVGLILLGGFVFNLIAGLLAGVASLFAVASGLGFAWVLVGLSNVLSLLIQGPLTAAAMVLLHQDLRVRQEGLDFDVLIGRLAARV